MTAPHLAVSSLSHRYGSTVAVDLARLVLAPGTTALLGPNGSGKSTLLRVLATVSMPQVGEVRIGGLDPTDPVERIAIRRCLGYQPQSNALPDRMRAIDFCDYVATLKEIESARLRRRWSHWAMHRVGLDELRNQRISALSGGQRRRLTLAQALIGGPELLILDEPLASLDATHRSIVAALVRERGAEATVVVATHHADELAAVCDRVLVLSAGTVAFAGSPIDLAEVARGRAWDASSPDPSAACRSTGDGRWRCVGEAVPADAVPAEPSVHDGYLVVLSEVDIGSRGADNGA